ncbi:VirK/YbjX family protein [Helicobacter sp. 11S02596-1]|uniref:VirK/YbjX family protein n=1 Tax=Helicobacter sp. 11S02596-1 TaxID=1476194 RepID=UPI002151702E|nr:VirK/YbjX family protein [Helicobacter sp. 11S02596-1]
MIASIQGAKITEVGNDEIKLLTKKCFGLRPPALLIEVLKMLAKSLACQRTLGITQKSQVRSNKGLKKGFNVDYDKMFQESGGELLQVGRHYYHWLSPTRKNLEDISSHKRSMYKKRFEMLEEIQGKMDKIFSVKEVNN